MLGNAGYNMLRTGQTAVRLFLQTIEAINRGYINTIPKYHIIMYHMENLYIYIDAIPGIPEIKL